jgi:dTDP-D-glucose 4,6-dehydratase
MPTRFSLRSVISPWKGRKNEWNKDHRPQEGVAVADVQPTGKSSPGGPAASAGVVKQTEPHPKTKLPPQSNAEELLAQSQTVPAFLPRAILHLPNPHLSGETEKLPEPGMICQRCEAFFPWVQSPDRVAKSGRPGRFPYYNLYQEWEYGFAQGCSLCFIPRSFGDLTLKQLLSEKRRPSLTWISDAKDPAGSRLPDESILANVTRNNVYGTHVLLESAKEVGIRRFIHVSCFHRRGLGRSGKEWRGFVGTQHSCTNYCNPYAATKAAAEMLVVAYSKSFKLPSIIVRSNNVYGPHQFPESECRRWNGRNQWINEALEVIPNFINLLERERPLIIHGDGEHARRYLYAADAADAFDTILRKGTVGHVYNVGLVDEVSNLELCVKPLNILAINNTHGWINRVKDRPFNNRRYAVDGTKLKQLGWNQKVKFDDGLKTTVQWYHDFPNWWGDISNVLTAFPVLDGTFVMADKSAGELDSFQNSHKISCNGSLGRTHDNLSIGQETTAGVQNGAVKKRKLDQVE